MNIDEIALRVAERLEPRGRTYSPDHYIEFAHALLAELSKQEPVAWLQISVEEGTDTKTARLHRPRKFNSDWWKFEPLFLHPLPVEAIEQRVAEACAKMLEGLAWRVKPASANEVAEEIRSGKWRE